MTDYDVWHPTHGEVSVEAVLATMTEATEGARRLLAAALPEVAALGLRPAHDALAGAIQTAPDAIDPTEARRLDPLVGRYLTRS